MNKINSFHHEEDETLAEFIGILLGDGHLHKKGEKSKAEKKRLQRVAFDKACLFLDSWFGLAAFGS